jgi:CRISPR system Cascade subunit CasC
MLIQIHILQNYAPANLNRDDSGSPKDAMFGGKQRGRISSQCLKRSIRRSATFDEAFAADGLLGVRTRGLPGLIQSELEALGASDEELQAIVRRAPEIGRESTKRKTQEAEDENQGTPAEAEAETATKQLIFLNPRELRPLAEGLLARYREAGAKGWDKLEIKEITRALPGGLPRSVDIAMFGRMTTSEAFEDVQAAVQVAHALSTNALTQEFDYYTAVDDISGESGAGMIGDVEYNSSTYYKYLSVHWEQLVHNLGGDVDVARRAVLALVEAAATAQPTGKQNSFAAHNLPDLVLVEVSARNLAVSYANAFLKPARPVGDQTVMDISVKQLGDYMARLAATYNLNAVRGFVATQEYALPDAEALPSLADLRGWLDAHLPEA